MVNKGFHKSERLRKPVRQLVRYNWNEFGQDFVNRVITFVVKWSDGQIEQYFFKSNLVSMCQCCKNRISLCTAISTVISRCVFEHMITS